MVIDIHAHILVPEILGNKGPETWRPTIQSQPDGGYIIKNHQFQNGPAYKSIHQPGEMASAFEEMGVDYAVLSTPPYAFFYDLPAAEGERASQIQNDGLQRVVEAYPKRFGGLGTVPLQDVPRAVRELERIMNELHLSGVEIASSIHGSDLGDDRYRPFWETAERLGAVVFVHPAYFDQVGGERMRQYYLNNLLGNPMETTLFAANLIFAGVLEDYPGLKIVLAHAGGVLPYLRGRLEQGYKVRREAKVRISRPPGDYLKMFFYDTLTHHAPTLQFLIEQVGADHVLLGSDYPFDMGYTHPLEILNQLDGLDADARAGIEGGNAERVMEGIRDQG